jgi:hypothetical protein
MRPHDLMKLVYFQNKKSAGVLLIVYSASHEFVDMCRECISYIRLRVGAMSMSAHDGWFVRASAVQSELQQQNTRKAFVGVDNIRKQGSVDTDR